MGLLVDYTPTPNATQDLNPGFTRQAQGFKLTRRAQIEKVTFRFNFTASVKCELVLAPHDNVTVIATSDTVAITQATPAFIDLPFSTPPTLEPNTQYYARLVRLSGGVTISSVDPGTYPDGDNWYFNVVTWVQSTEDLLFQVFGTLEVAGGDIINTTDTNNIITNTTESSEVLTNITQSSRVIEVKENG